MMTSEPTLRPADAEELRQIVQDAAGSTRALEVVAGGSKRDIGLPGREAAHVDIQALSGIVTYEPSELVLTVRPATPLAEVEALLSAHGQMLAFEPWDHGPLYGRAAGAATIGGIVAGAVAGSRRVSAGGARDHLLGFTAVSGRGEQFKAGGKVVKNVTGYDVSKVMAGSWGQLAILTELTLKVVPVPRASLTVTLSGLSPALAVAAMAKAMGSPDAPAAAAHIPSANPQRAITALRLEGFPESIGVRAGQLIAALGSFGAAERIDEEAAGELWSAIRDARPLGACDTLWRLHVAPSRAAELIAALEASGAAWLCDWAGALVWAGAPADVDVRGIAGTCDAHAMLIRAPLELRARVPARQPETPAVTALSARLKHAFDPAGILDPDRFT